MKFVCFFLVLQQNFLNRITIYHSSLDFKSQVVRPETLKLTKLDQFNQLYQRKNRTHLSRTEALRCENRDLRLRDQRDRRELDQAGLELCIKQAELESYSSDSTDQSSLRARGAPKSLERPSERKFECATRAAIQSRQSLAQLPNSVSSSRRALAYSVILNQTS